MEAQIDGTVSVVSGVRLPLATSTIQRAVLLPGSISTAMILVSSGDHAATYHDPLTSDSSFIVAGSSGSMR